MEVIVDCPMGRQCEYIKDNVMHRCHWFTKLVGKNPQGEDFIEEWKCAVTWLPFMMVEIAQTNRGQTQATCSMRDEVVNRFDVFNGIALRSLQLKGGEEIKEIPS
jgi:hypothetical protein